MKVAVVGHVEWVQFALVERVPRTGDFAHASDAWSEAGGGAGVAASVLARLADSCTLFTAFGDDDIGRLAKLQLESWGIEVHASFASDQRTNYTFCHIDASGQRTGTIISDLEPSGTDASLPWHKLAEMDAVYFVSGDTLVLEYARKARVLVSTARTLPILKSASLPLDALVMSAHDPAEKYRTGELNPEPKLVVRTNGRSGETTNGRLYPAEVVSKSEFVDSYGCGDSFAAGLTFALAQNLPLDDSLALAAHEGAEAALRHGVGGLANF